jgi:hypothetical protein
MTLRFMVAPPLKDTELVCECLASQNAPGSLIRVFSFAVAYKDGIFAAVRQGAGLPADRRPSRKPLLTA